MNGQKRLGTFINGQKRSGTVINGQTGMNGQECSNALELLVENGNGTVALMFQKRKKIIKV